MDDAALHELQLTRFRAMAERLGDIAGQPGYETLGALAGQLRELAEAPESVPESAPSLIARLLTVAPGVATIVPRDLLWYLGGECLHFMPDDEIERYSRLDDDRRAATQRGEYFDWLLACAPTSAQRH